METLNPIDHLQYIRDLAIQPYDASFPIYRDGIEIADGIDQSFMSAKSLVSFVAGVTAQRRSDVLNSLLLAQLAANKQFPDPEQVVDWYKAFVKVLPNLGWVIEGSEFSTFESSGTEAEVENIVIDILTSAFGSPFKAIIISTLGGIKKLSDANGKIKAFEKNTHSQSKGAFQIGVAKEENDTVALQLGSFIVSSNEKINRILFVKVEKNKTTLQYCSSKGTLNEDVYSKIRQAVSDKLGVRFAENVTDIDI